MIWQLLGMIVYWEGSDRHAASRV